MLGSCLGVQVNNNVLGLGLVWGYGRRQLPAGPKAEQEHLGAACWGWVLLGSIGMS